MDESLSVRGRSSSRLFGNSFNVSQKSSSMPSVGNMTDEHRVLVDAPLALSVRQPWAELIMSGRKTIEVRSWAAEYRGVLWIHTGVNVDAAAALTHNLRDLFTGGYLG